MLTLPPHTWHHPASPWPRQASAPLALCYNTRTCRRGATRARWSIGGVYHPTRLARVRFRAAPTGVKRPSAPHCVLGRAYLQHVALDDSRQLSATTRAGAPLGSASASACSHGRVRTEADSLRILRLVGYQFPVRRERRPARRIPRWAAFFIEERSRRDTGKRRRYLRPTRASTGARSFHRKTTSPTHRTRKISGYRKKPRTSPRTRCESPATTK